MAGDLKSKYGTSNQAITITLNSLAAGSTGGAGAGRASTAVDNSTNVFLDALVQVKVVVGTVSSDKAVYVYAYGTADGGTNYTDGITGTDAAFTRTDPANVRLIGIVNCPTNSGTFVGGPFPVAVAFGGVLPDHWGILVVNSTGAALAASGCSAWYQGAYGQYT